MSLLLDTQPLLWWLDASPSLSRAAREAIAADPSVYVSAASIWEIAIKRQLGKLEVDDGYRAALAEDGFLDLDVTANHADRVNDLPKIHRDPFDRILVSQAQVEGLTLVTGDRAISRYPVDVLW